MAPFAMPMSARARRLARLSSMACLASHVAAAQAHGMPAAPGAALTFGWHFEPWVTSLLAASLALYGLGFARLDQRGRGGRSARRLQAAAFVAGWLSLALVLVSPLDALSGALFSAHMVEHEAMMLLCAPLLVLGRPLGIMLWALPRAARVVAGQTVRSRTCTACWRRLASPLWAWMLHAAALWAWHVPVLFESAVAHPAVHALQHTSFLVTALLLWRGIVGEGATRRGTGHAMLSLFTTMVHTGALGALIALAPGIWYPSYIEPANALGIDPLQDQQLGGLIMWVPGALAYLIGALLVAARWLDKRARSPRPERWAASQTNMHAFEDQTR